MKKLVSLLLVAAVSCSLGCAASYARTPAPREGDAHAQADDGLVNAINDFGFRVLESSTAPGKNAIISPVSLHSMLTEVRLGARGTTASEMDSVLGLADGEAVAPDYANLVARLRAVNGATVNVANAIWFDEGFTPETAFVEANRDFFGADIETADLSDAGSKKAIDAWISSHTAGKIRDAALEPDPLLRVELVNALYFLGKWENAFEKRDTFEETFHFDLQYPSDIDMMHASGKYLYAEDDAAQMVRLPYKGGDVVAYVLVPVSEHTVADTVAGLNAASWRHRVASLEEREGSVALPRVQLTAGADGLESILATMGMPTAFGAGADLSGMGDSTDEPLYLSGVVHRVYLQVDEKGTEAAAFSVSGTTAAVETLDDALFSLIANRPFLLAIADEDSGCLLFVGAIADPRQ